jgi:DNA-directed RNA polymerase specialized sigma24 family protein
VDGVCLTQEQACWIYSRAARLCRAAGLSPEDAEDIAQDVWVWLLKSDRLSQALAAPWLNAVVRNFLRRYWRRQSRQRLREGPLPSGLAECQQAYPSALDLLLAVDVAVSSLSTGDALLVGLVRHGHSFAEAARLLGIPKGSHAFVRQRLIRRLRAVIAHAAPTMATDGHCYIGQTAIRPQAEQMRSAAIRAWDSTVTRKPRVLRRPPATNV